MRPTARLAIPERAALALWSIVAIAIPASASAQNVSCTACTHEVSYFKGKGGLIAKADGTTEVTWVAQCGGVVRSGKLEANDDGIVATLFDDDNNLACSGDDGRFRLGPVTDGGWFWITDDMNSAVGNLMNKNVLDNRATTLANAGAGVETAAGKGVTFVKETATGRVGILPNILPVAPVPPTRKCGFTGTPDAGTSTAGKRRIATNCKLGDGGGMLVLHGPVGVGGTQAPLLNNTITRPRSGVVSVQAKYFLNGSGHYVADPNGDPDLGWLGGSEFSGGVAGRWYIIRPAPANPLRVRAGVTNTALTESTGVAEVSAGEYLAIASTSAGTYCGTAESPKNNPMKVTVIATLNAPVLDDVVPNVVPKRTPALDGSNATISEPPGGRATLTIVCPSAAAAQEGGEPMLENPLSTE